jgi:hypothetical protein
MRLVLLVSLAGCSGYNCFSTCDIIFGTAAGECAIVPSGVTTDVEIQRLVRDCRSQCQGAMAEPGEVTEGYNPNERAGNQSDIELHTDKDAALWMECVAETACEDLDAGYCAPTKNF